MQTVTGYAMKAWASQAPPELQETTRNYHEMINMPRIGSEDNDMWPTLQMNVAPAQRSEAGKYLLICICILPPRSLLHTETSLSVAMGVYGGKHRDGNDSSRSFSSMTVLSDLPAGNGWESGMQPRTVIYTLRVTDRRKQVDFTC